MAARNHWAGLDVRERLTVVFSAVSVVSTLVVVAALVAESRSDACNDNGGSAPLFFFVVGLIAIAGGIVSGVSAVRTKPRGIGSLLVALDASLILVYVFVIVYSLSHIQFCF